MDEEQTPATARLGGGRELGGYVLGDELGSGGMGVVYRAVDADGNEVALKLLHPHIAADPEARSRLRREVATLQRVRGAGVARVLDAETELDDAFVVTELIDGLTLNESVRIDGVFAGQELADFADDMFRALTAIHAVGVVHRDLKPSNVMVTDNGPVLIDFGIAHAADESRITQTGMVMGTPGYLAPEVLSGATSSPDSDWWAQAAVLLFAATGRPAFGRGSLDVILGRVTSGGCDVEGLDPELATIYRQALEPEPTKRTAPADFLEALQDYGATAAPIGELDHTDDDLRTEAITGDRRTRLPRALPLFPGSNGPEGETGTVVVPAAGSDYELSVPKDSVATSLLGQESKTEMVGGGYTATRAFTAADLNPVASSGKDDEVIADDVPRPPAIVPGVAPQEIAAPSRHSGVAVGELPGRVQPTGGVPTPIPQGPGPVAGGYQGGGFAPGAGVTQRAGIAPGVGVGQGIGVGQGAGVGQGRGFTGVQPGSPGAQPFPIPPGGQPGVPPMVATPAPLVTPTAPGIVLALAAASVGFGIVAPGITMIVLAMVLLVAQTARLAGRAGERMWSERGKRPSAARIAVGWPWYMVRALVPTLTSWAFAVAAGILVVASVELVVAIGLGGDLGLFGLTASRWPMQARGGAAGGLALAALVAWCGPFGSRNREGVARIARNIMPAAMVRNIVSIVLIAASILLIIVVLAGTGTPNWSPFTWR